MPEKSLAHELYDSFKKDVQFQVRQIKQYLKGGEILSEVEIVVILDNLFIVFTNDLEDIDPREAVRWINKAESLLDTVQSSLIESEIFGDVIESADIGADFNLTEGEITLDGIVYPLVNDGDNPMLSRMGAKRRGRQITTLSELDEYVSEIPTVAGIQIVYNSNGIITGYRVWVYDKS